MKSQLLFGICVLVAANARTIFNDRDEEVEELLGFEEDIPSIIVKNLPGFPKLPVGPGLKPEKTPVNMLDIIKMINFNKQVGIKMFSIFIADAVKQVIDEVQCEKPAAIGTRPPPVGPSGGTGGPRPSGGTGGPRPSGGTGGPRPSGGTGGSRPSGGTGGSPPSARTRAPLN